jgi:integrase
MSKPLTAAAVAKWKPHHYERLENPDAACPGLYFVVEPSGAKSYYSRFRRPNGEPARLKLGSCDVTGKESEGEPVIGGHLTLAAARRLNTEVRRQLALGRDPAADWLAEKRRRRVIADEKAGNTFAAAARKFIDEHIVSKRGRKPRRWRETARILGLDYPIDGGEPTEIPDGLAQRWRDKPIAEIDGHDLYSVIDDARRRGIPGLERRNDGISDARGRKMADALSPLFGSLHAHRRIAVDPSIGIWRPPPAARRDRVLNVKPDVRRADELRWFWSACDAVSQPFGKLLKVKLLTGCRLSEIARMTWDELSDDLAILRLPGERTKNGLPHDVALPQLVRDLLEEARRIEGCRYVFSTTGRTPVSGFSKIKRQLDAAMLAKARKERGKDARIEKWRLHDLRRTCGTGMAGIGIAPHIVEAALNHVSGAKAGVAGTYNVERYESEKRAALERWAAHVARLVAGKPADIVPLRASR